MELGVIEGGAGDETIVFLHGFGGFGRVWEPVARHFSASCRTLCYDLPGHGASRDWPQAGPARTATSTVLEDLERRGIGRAHFVGHSLGGAIAALVGLSQPQRAASLTLLAPGGFGPEINARVLDRFASARDAATLRHTLEAMFGWMSPVSDELVSRYEADRSQVGAVERPEQVVAHLSRDGRQREIPHEKLAGLAMPVSVVWGEFDNVLPYRQTRGLPAHFALHSLSDKGHMLIEEAEETVVTAIRRNLGMNRAY